MRVCSASGEPRMRAERDVSVVRERRRALRCGHQINACFVCPVLRDAWHLLVLERSAVRYLMRNIRENSAAASARAQGGVRARALLGLRGKVR